MRFPKYTSIVRLYEGPSFRCFFAQYCRLSSLIIALAYRLGNDGSREFTIYPRRRPSHHLLRYSTLDFIANAPLFRQFASPDSFTIDNNAMLFNILIRAIQSANTSRTFSDICILWYTSSGVPCSFFCRQSRP